MEKRMVGNSGLEVSVVGLGGNNFGGMIQSLGTEEARGIVDAAIDAGVTLFDTADSYGVDGGSEKVLGEVLGNRRKDIILATKFSSPVSGDYSERFNGSRGYIMKAVENSLQRLKTDYIDLYQYHFPDPVTPIDETLRALDDLVSQGKVRYIGCSNMVGWQLVDANWVAKTNGWARLLSTQTEYNLLDRSPETELFPAMKSIGMTLLPYFPLASGLLTGKYRKGQPVPEDTHRMKIDHFRAGLTEDRLDVVERLIAFAEARDHTILELAISWLLANPTVSSVIAGATKPSQVTANVKAATWKLSDNDLAELNKLMA